MSDPFIFRRGETITLLLEAIDASEDDLAVVAAVTAVLKRTVYGDTIPTSDPPVAIFTVTARNAQGGSLPGWDCTIADDVSATLRPGIYVTNAHLELQGGETEITEPVLIEIVAAA